MEREREIQSIVVSFTQHYTALYLSGLYEYTKKKMKKREI